MVFLRGEVIAKADHTEQILYSDIGMFVFALLQILFVKELITQVKEQKIN